MKLIFFKNRLFQRVNKEQSGCFSPDEIIKPWGKFQDVYNDYVN